MREATLGLYYFVKYLELIFLCVWSVMLFVSGISLVNKVSEEVEGDNDTLIYIFTGITLVLVLFNLFYNNLLINLRFLAKMRCVTFGLCLFDAINYAFCYCFLAKPCKDRCFSLWTLGKWAIKGGIIGYTIYLVQQKQDDWDQAWELGSFDRDAPST